MTTPGSSVPAPSSPGAAPPPDRAVEAGRGALFLAAGKVFFMVSAAAQKFILTHIVGSAEYGAFSVVNGAVSILNNATVQGTIQSVSKFTAEDDARAAAVKRAGVQLQLVLGTALGLALVLGAPWIADYYKMHEFASWFRLVAIIPFAYSIYSVFVGSANGLRRFRIQASFDIGFASMKTLFLLGGAAVLGVTGALGGFSLAALVILPIAAYVMRNPRMAPGQAPFPVPRLVVFMVYIVAYTLLMNVALNYDNLLLRRFLALATDPKSANQLAGYYDGVRNLALLPNGFLMIGTFVIFPLVSRSTFQQERDATRAYVTQTLRYALILAVAMAVVLSARPLGLMTTMYPAEYGAGAGALPILVAGIACLSLLGVSGAIINASGRPLVAIALVAGTVAICVGASFVLVPGQPPGPAMLVAAASASALGMAAGLAGALVYLRKEFRGGPPLASVVRVLVAAGIALAVGHFFPGKGKIANLLAVAVVGVVYLGALIALGEFGPQDREKFRKILRRR